MIGKEIKRQVKELVTNPGVLNSWGNILYAYSITGSLIVSMPMIVEAGIITGLQIRNQNLPADRQKFGLPLYAAAFFNYAQGASTLYFDPQNLFASLPFFGWGAGTTLLAREEQIFKQKKFDLQKKKAAIVKFIDDKIVSFGSDISLLSNAVAGPETAPLFVGIIATSHLREWLRAKNILKPFKADTRVRSVVDFVDKHASNMKLSGANALIQSFVLVGKGRPMEAAGWALWGVGGFFFDPAKNDYFVRDAKETIQRASERVRTRLLGKSRPPARPKLEI